MDSSTKLIYGLAGMAFAAVAIAGFLYSEKGRRIVRSARNWFQKDRSRDTLLYTPETAHQRAEFEQAHQKSF